ncbi:cobyric acid synthase [Peptostreptococcus equinus]|uniref:Cobyric acid synthase n=1 Tax=Peptostreptococcus equinus TaxID=3003601 RepID=A0ABY7JRI5_9FIRM|nr:cobyric acid synthase [Peptostreptococcus sp. CBA3647]WAW15089.1 cobyric acid synthase [Peptostreptococcus sp. CBA3647]
MANIMFQGTASNVGKSIISAGICRFLVNEGFSVAPFKSQNMSLNSFIDINGGEMGRAQVFQAEACRIIPEAKMNPILLKPNKGLGSQLIVNGRVVQNMKADQYRKYKPSLLPILIDNYKYFEKNYDIVVLEGAGSPVEININELDISNMEMAKIADSPVVLIGDIDRGGVFASVVGTLQLMKEDERKRVKGIIINKFRGDKKSFDTGVKMLEELTNIPVLGVIPYIDIRIEEEDGVSDKLFNRTKLDYTKNADIINIEVIKLEHMSNFTDFNIFEYIDRVNLRFVKKGQNIGDISEDGELVLPDLLIIPGSKDTISDMDYLRKSGLDKQIIYYEKEGNPIVGICGGYQILGNNIIDTNGYDNNKASTKGLSILDVDTIFSKNKKTRQIFTQFIKSDLYFKDMEGIYIRGYELHFGDSKQLDKDRVENNIDNKSIFTIKNGQVLGTYCHGIFDNKDFTLGLINNICAKKGIEKIVLKEDLNQLKDKEYDKLSNHIRDNISVDLLYKIIFDKK